MNTVPKTQDTKAKSLSEAFVNSFGAYPIGYGIGIVILPLSMGLLKDDVYTANIFITLVYATFSFLRIFFLRRLFEKFGFDDNFIRLSVKLYNKVKQKILEKRSVFYRSDEVKAL